MKKFFSNVLANLVAIMIVFICIFFFFIAIIAIGSMGGESKVKVDKNSILTLSLNTQIIDSPTEDQDMMLFPSKNAPKKILLYDVLQAIEKAKNDENIKGISIEVDDISAGITHLDNIRAALEDFKKSGKFVYAYGNIVSQGAYYLGSVADQYFLNPVGFIELRGLSEEVTFFKDFADKYGIGLEVIRHGKFKAAVEPYLRNNISDENKEQLSVMLNDLWGQTSSKIARSRKINSNELKVIVDSLYSVIPDNNIRYKLADKLLQKSEYINLLKKKIGVKETESLNQISFNKYINSFKNENEENGEIAVLYASGTIENGDDINNIHSESFVKHIKELSEDDNIKAVVFRINSPGGSANASDEILFELQQLKKKKPLIVSFGNYAASGGYYIAMAADKIYAEPNTITGSIGVFGLLSNVKELANRNGIRTDVVSTNENSNFHSFLNGLTPGGKTIMTKSVEGTYKRFVHWVSENRKKTFDEVDAVGGGRVWTGSRAKEIGLVDDLGSLKDAISYAAKVAKLKDHSIQSFPKKQSPFEQLLKDLEGEEIYTKLMKMKLSEEQFKIYELLREPKIKSPIIMESPYRVNL